MFEFAEAEGAGEEVELSVLEAVCGGIGIFGPLPLEAEFGSGKVIGAGEGDRLPPWVRHGHVPGEDGIADAVTVAVHAGDRPTVLPGDGLEPDDAAEGAGVLKMEEPPAAVGGIDQGALMGAVDAGVAGFEDGADFVGSPGVSGAQDGLPAEGNAACGAEDEGFVPELVEFGAFDDRMFPVGREQVMFGTVVDHGAFTEKGRAVPCHFADIDAVVDAGAGFGVGERQPGVAGGFVPEGAGIDEAQFGMSEMRFRPGAFGVACFHVIDARIGVAPEDPEEVFVMPDAGGVDPAAEAGEVVIEFVGFAPGSGGGNRRQAVQRVSEPAPVHQVLGMKNGQPRDHVEAGGGEIKITADADDIGIGEIGGEDGIGVPHSCGPGSADVRDVQR